MIGGDKVNLTTYAILSKLIADKLATKYSWHGRKGKKVFAELFTAKLVISKYSISNNNLYFLYLLFMKYKITEKAYI